jgi:hypothetical protein
MIYVNLMWAAGTDAATRAGPVWAASAFAEPSDRSSGTRVLAQAMTPGEQPSADAWAANTVITARC